MPPSDLELRLTKAIEDIAHVTESFKESVLESQRTLNENFLLHAQNTETCSKNIEKALTAQCSEIHGLREDFKQTIAPLLKWAFLALIAMAAGLEAAKMLNVI